MTPPTECKHLHIRGMLLAAVLAACLASMLDNCRAPDPAAASDFTSCECETSRELRNIRHELAGIRSEIRTSRFK